MSAPKKLVRDIIFNDPLRFPVMVRWERGRLQAKSFLNLHREIELHYIKRGKGSYLIENRNYPFDKNSLIIISPGKIHRSLSEKNATRVEVIFEHITEEIDAKNEYWQEIAAGEVKNFTQDLTLPLLSKISYQNVKK